MGLGYKDLREWLAKVDEMGELKVVKSIDLAEDVGRIAEIAASLESAPALILDEFPGYAPGYRILLNPYGTTRKIAFTFGFPLDLDRKELVGHFVKKQEELKPIPPKYVNTGPILENRLVGDKVDLYRIPVPKWHLDDGGPYIGTGTAVITQDPDEGWVNLGTYRSQLFDKKTVGEPGGMDVPQGTSHGGKHKAKYLSRGQPCPIAIVFGMDPLLFAASMLDVPWGLSEYDWVGGWRGEPVEVIKGPITGLPIPARAEIVIEGFVYPDKKSVWSEGPFGEWAGYYTSPARDRPGLEVQALYFRNNPILLGMPPQRPPYDADKARQYLKSALLVKELKRQGILGITNAWCYGLGGCRLLVAVAIKQLHAGHSRQVGHAVWSSPVVANRGNRYIVVVDDDIDVTDLDDVMWAVITRSDPATSIDIIPRAITGGLTPIPSPAERAANRNYTSVAIIDATKPYEWINEFPKNVQPDQEYRRESRKKFAHIFEGAPQLLAR